MAGCWWRRGEGARGSRGWAASASRIRVSARAGHTRAHTPQLGDTRAAEGRRAPPCSAKGTARGCHRTLRGGDSPAVPSGTGTRGTGGSSHRWCCPCPRGESQIPAEESPGMSRSLQSWEQTPQHTSAEGLSLNGLLGCGWGSQVGLLGAVSAPRKAQPVLPSSDSCNLLFQGHHGSLHHPDRADRGGGDPTQPDGQSQQEGAPETLLPSLVPTWGGGPGPDPRLTAAQSFNNVQ